MVVFVLEKVPRSSRGYLSRWCLEIRTGTFVGTLSRRVREALWEDLCSSLKTGSAIQIYTANNEQGFKIEMWGYPSRRVREMDGLQLIEVYKLPDSHKKKVKRLKHNDKQS